MSILFDVILIAIVLLPAVRGWRRGILSTILSILGWAAAAIVIAGFSESWSQNLYTNTVEPRAIGAVERAIPAETVTAMQAGADAAQSVQSVLDDLGGLLGGQTVDASAARAIESALRQDAGSLARTITQEVLRPMLLAISRAIISALILVVCLALFGLLARLARRRRRRGGILSRTNQLLGGVLGAAEGVAVGYLYALLLSLLATWPRVTWVTDAALRSTYLVKLFLK